MSSNNRLGSRDFKSYSIFSGTSSLLLAKKICKILNVDLAKSETIKFSDSEFNIKILEKVVNLDVFVVQSTSFPANDNLIELLLMVDALRRASCRSITAIIPYYGYARQDRKDVDGSCISARLIATLLESSGVNRVVTVDLHSDQIEGFFNIPLINIRSTPVLCSYIESVLSLELDSKNEIMVVSPDVGGLKRLRMIADFLKCDLAVVDKSRIGNNKVIAKNIIGDVKGKTVIIVDDIIDTAGTLKEAIEILTKSGVEMVYVFCTHPVLSGSSLNRIMNSSVVRVIVTDTIPLADKAVRSLKIDVLSIANLLSETIISIL